MTSRRLESEQVYFNAVYTFLEPFDDLYFWRSTTQNKGHLAIGFQVGLCYSIHNATCGPYILLILHPG